MRFKKVLIFIFPLLLLGCNKRTDTETDNGTAWAAGSFSTNGQRIYFTSTSNRGTSITYEGGPAMGMMMMGGRLACVSCHGTDAKGGRHMMHMEVMDAPDIRWSALINDHENEESKSNHDSKNESYDLADFRNSVEYGKHPDGEFLSEDMPRWHMSDEDLTDLINYLKSLK